MIRIEEVRRGKMFINYHHIVRIGEYGKGDEKTTEIDMIDGSNLETKQSMEELVITISQLKDLDRENSK